jgi:Flp pilus assembly pilin Flp
VRLLEERGEVYVEYTVLGSLAVLVILGAIQYFFGGISYLFQKMGDILRGIG